MWIVSDCTNQIQTGQGRNVIKTSYLLDHVGQCWTTDWRMGRDSNPRDACAPAGFQDRCLQPLGHPSNTELAGILESEGRKSNGVDIGANQIVLASRLRQRRRSLVGRQAKYVGGATDQSPIRDVRPH